MKATPCQVTYGIPAAAVAPVVSYGILWCRSPHSAASTGGIEPSKKNGQLAAEWVQHAISTDHIYRVIQLNWDIKCNKALQNWNLTIITYYITMKIE